MYFKTFWPCSFVDPSVKGNDNLWKVCGLIDGFNESFKQIASVVEERQMSQLVPYYFVPVLK